MPKNKKEEIGLGSFYFLSPRSEDLSIYDEQYSDSIKQH